MIFLARTMSGAFLHGFVLGTLFGLWVAGMTVFGLLYAST